MRRLRNPPLDVVPEHNPSPRRIHASHRETGANRSRINNSRAGRDPSSPAETRPNQPGRRTPKASGTSENETVNVRVSTRAHPQLPRTAHHSASPRREWAPAYARRCRGRCRQLAEPVHGGRSRCAAVAKHGHLERMPPSGSTRCAGSQTAGDLSSSASSVRLPRPARRGHAGHQPGRTRRR
jgi:hypothetical protein